MPEAQVTGTAEIALPSARHQEPWFCVYTYPLRERATEYRIREEGHTAWLPLEAPPRRVKVERERVIQPLIPRYLFAQAYPWLVVRNRGGEEMARVLTSPTTRKPLIVPPDEMESLMAQCGPDGIFHPPEPREVRRKDLVRVEDGPFTDFTGIVQRTTRERVWILLSLFGRASEVPFTRKQVELME